MRIPFKNTSRVARIHRINKSRCRKKGQIFLETSLPGTSLSNSTHLCQHCSGQNKNVGFKPPFSSRWFRLTSLAPDSRRYRSFLFFVGNYPLFQQSLGDRGTRDEFFTSFTWKNTDFNGILSSRFTQILSFWFEESILEKKKEYGDKKKKKREIVLMKFIFVSTAPMHVLAAHSSRRQQMSNTGPKALHANDINSVDSLAIR